MKPAPSTREFEDERHPPDPVLQAQSQWPAWLRKLAVTLWSGFIGAVLLMLALLMSWETFQHSGDEPSFALLAAAFAICWLGAAITALIALSLATEPRPKLSVRREP